MIETVKLFILDQLKHNEFFKGGAVIAIFSAIGLYLKSFIPWISGRIKRQFSYVVCIESRTDIYLIFNWWLKNNHSNKYKKVLLSAECENRWEEDKIKKYNISENNFDSSFYFWHKKMPIFLESSREKLDGAHYVTESYIDRYTLTTFFNRKTLKSLIDHVVHEYNNSLKEKTASYLMQYYNHDGWRKVTNLGGKTLDKIFNKEKTELLLDLEQFFESKDLYEHRGIPFKRGYLCEGSPGNGKTTTIIALAQYLKKDIYSLNLTSLTDGNQLRLAFQGVKENSFILIEDADCMVNGREKITDKINFSELLNVIDGVGSQEGVCVFFTTNHPEKLDPALIRCGRIDKKITFNNPNQEDVEGMLDLFFGEKVKLERYDNKHSAAQIQEFFIKSKSIEEAINKII